LSLRCHLQFQVQNRSGAGEHGDAPFLGSESLLCYAHHVVAQGYGVKLEIAFRASLGGLREIRVCGLQDDVRIGDRPVLRIMNDSTHSSKGRGKCAAREQK